MTGWYFDFKVILQAAFTHLIVLRFPIRKYMAMIALMTIFTTVLPIVFILALAMFFRTFRENTVVERIFIGLRPCVVALIAAPVFTMAKSAKVTWSNVWIPIASALLIWMLGVSPIVVVLVAALGGYLYSRLRHNP